MRYYRIELYKAQKTDMPSISKMGELYVPKSIPQMQSQGCTWTSYIGQGSSNTPLPGGFSGAGRSIPGALNVEFDISVVAQGLPASPGQWVKVWGISLEEIGQANDLFGYGAVIYGGFRKGLPLAKPEQSQSPLTSGWIIQSFGNWKLTELSLEFMITSGAFKATRSQPGNFILNWIKKAKLGDAIRSAILGALPNVVVRINISDQLTQENSEWGVYPTLSEFSDAVVYLSRQDKFKGITTKSGDPYSGIRIDILGDGSIRVSDDSTTIVPGIQQGAGGGATPGLTQLTKSIKYQDIIGQPSWINVNTIQFQCPMRSDIEILDFIDLPISLNMTSTIPRLPSRGQQPLGNARDKLMFSGPFQVTKMRHVGNFRQASASSWITTMDAIVIGRNTSWDPKLNPGVNPVNPYLSPKR